jgi:hypothetical protein
MFSFSQACFIDILVIFKLDTSFGVVEVMTVNKDCLESVMWILVTCIETTVNVAVFTILILYVCGCTAVQVTRYTNVLY